MSNSPGVNPSRLRVADADRCGHFSGLLKPFGASVGARRQFRRAVQDRSRGNWPERGAQTGIAPLVPGKPLLGDIFGCWRCVPRGLGGSLDFSGISARRSRTTQGPLRDFHLQWPLDALPHCLRGARRLPADRPMGVAGRPGGSLSVPGRVPNLAPIASHNFP